MQISILTCKRERQLQFFFLSWSTYQYHNNGSQKSQNQNNDEASNSATLKALLVNAFVVTNVKLYLNIFRLLMSQSSGTNETKYQMPIQCKYIYYYDIVRFAIVRNLRLGLFYLSAMQKQQ